MTVPLTFRAERHGDSRRSRGFFVFVIGGPSDRHTREFLEPIRDVGREPAAQKLLAMLALRYPRRSRTRSYWEYERAVS